MLWKIWAKQYTKPSPATAWRAFRTLGSIYNGILFESSLGQGLKKWIQMTSHHLLLNDGAERYAQYVKLGTYNYINSCGMR